MHREYAISCNVATRTWRPADPTRIHADAQPRIGAPEVEDKTAGERDGKDECRAGNHRIHVSNERGRMGALTTHVRFASHTNELGATEKTVTFARFIEKMAKKYTMPSRQMTANSGVLTSLRQNVYVFHAVKLKRKSSRECFSPCDEQKGSHTRRRLRHRTQVTTEET